MIGGDLSVLNLFMITGLSLKLNFRYCFFEQESFSLSS
jgi:hypothetical protein